MIIQNIQILRFFAAFLVVLHHTLPPNIHPAHYAKIPAFITEISLYGFAGVDIFFVISGFIMAQTTRNISPGPQAAGSFVMRRFWRIYSGYWPAFFLTLGLSIWLGIFQGPEISRLGSFLLWPQEYYLLNVSWTLSYELYFYLLIGLVLLISRKWAWAILAALFLSLAMYVIGGFAHGLYLPERYQSLSFIFQVFLTSPLILEFFAGFLLSEFLHRYPRQPVHWWLLATVMAIAASVYYQKYGGLQGVGMAAFLYYPQRVLFFGTASVGLVAVAALAPSGRGVFGALLHRLGDASYALYLLHIPLLVILYGLLFPRIPGLLWWSGGKLALLSYLLLAVLASWAYFKWVETPLNRLGRRWLPGI